MNESRKDCRATVPTQKKTKMAEDKRKSDNKRCMQCDEEGRAELGENDDRGKSVVYVNVCVADNLGHAITLLPFLLVATPLLL